MSETPEMIVARAIEDMICTIEVGDKAAFGYRRGHALKIARAAIAAHRAALQEAGLVIVPREATEAMLNAARDWSLKKYGQAYNHDRAAESWRSMVTVALS